MNDGTARGFDFAEEEDIPEIEVDGVLVGLRCDVAAAEGLSLTRSAAQKLLAEGRITVNGEPKPKNYKVRAGDVLAVDLPETEICAAEPEDIPLDVVYEDDEIIVVNKPQGMVVHPAPGHPCGTLVNALLSHCGQSLSGVNGVMRPGIVHRIDRDTSGLLCAAKTDRAHQALSEQLKTHAMYREYRAILCGGFPEDEGTIDAPIGRDPKDRKKMAVIRTAGKTARRAVTHYRVLARCPGFSYVEAVLETGRTHQIRVHMAYAGHPILGDVLYGGGRTAFEKRNAPLLHGQCLHAAALVLTHPKTGETMRFSASLPPDFEELLRRLGLP